MASVAPGWITMPPPGAATRRGSPCRASAPGRWRPRRCRRCCSARCRRATRRPVVSTHPSNAKVNLHLQVVGRRADGYHELRTIFQTVDLADELDVDLVPGGAIELAVEGADLPTGPTNLAHRAAAGF